MCDNCFFNLSIVISWCNLDATTFLVRGPTYDADHVKVVLNFSLTCTWDWIVTPRTHTHTHMHKHKSDSFRKKYVQTSGRNNIRFFLQTSAFYCATHQSKSFLYYCYFLIFFLLFFIGIIYLKTQRCRLLQICLRHLVFHFKLLFV